MGGIRHYWTYSSSSLSRIFKAQLVPRKFMKYMVIQIAGVTRTRCPKSLQLSSKLSRIQTGWVYSSQNCQDNCIVGGFNFFYDFLLISRSAFSKLQVVGGLSIYLISGWIQFYTAIARAFNWGALPNMYNFNLSIFMNQVCSINCEVWLHAFGVDPKALWCAICFDTFGNIKNRSTDPYYWIMSTALLFSSGKSLSHSVTATEGCFKFICSFAQPCYSIHWHVASIFVSIETQISHLSWISVSTTQQGALPSS